MNFDRRIEETSREKREQVERLELFDANVWLGEPAGFPLAAAMDWPELKRTMEGYGIRQALVSHWAGLWVAAQEGNRRLLAAVPEPGAPAVPGIWTGLPLFPGEEGPLPGVGEAPACLRGVRLFPRSHNYPITTWVLGELCAWLAEMNLPLFLWHVEVDWPSLHALASAFTKLAVVVETQTQKILYHDRPLAALMRACPNVHVEISNLAGAGFLAYAVRELGAERLLFGSFLPVNDPWVPVGLILDAEIGWEDKRLIAGGNLRRLLAGAPA
jgi:hypothetical protein